MIEPPEPPIVVRPPQPNERPKSEPLLEQAESIDILEMFRNAGFDVPQGAYMDVSESGPKRRCPTAGEPLSCFKRCRLIGRIDPFHIGGRDPGIYIIEDDRGFFAADTDSNGGYVIIENGVVVNLAPIDSNQERCSAAQDTAEYWRALDVSAWKEHLWFFHGNLEDALNG